MPEDNRRAFYAAQYFNKLTSDYWLPDIGGELCEDLHYAFKSGRSKNDHGSLQVAQFFSLRGIIFCSSHAYEHQNNCCEANYVELAEFIQDYYDPIKKLSDEFTRDHQRVLKQAIESCVNVYNERSAFVDKWNKTEFLSMIAAPAKSFLTPSYSHFDMTTCELIPLESLETVSELRH